jgi:hypothetical protein
MNLPDGIFTNWIETASVVEMVAVQKMVTLWKVLVCYKCCELLFLCTSG